MNENNAPQTPNLFAKKHLLDALRAAQLPFSYPTILRYEAKGLIHKPKGMVVFNDRAWRVYTQEEIDEIVSIIKVNNAKQVVSYEDTSNTELQNM